MKDQQSFRELLTPTLAQLAIVKPALEKAIAITAESHCGIGTMWDAELGQCVFNVECAGDINLDGAITSGDILLMLANFGTYCPGYGPDAGE